MNNRPQPTRARRPRAVAKALPAPVAPAIVVAAAGIFFALISLALRVPL